ncbi:PDDEXK nuclease domain-containing protein [Prosthecobacter sp.]|uniref:PDDEXK nuclease domain-containing protein n=1 Tax=Prosthecobacter sp. TaxID=1965333 RepID=UPI002ABC3309|nr:PDDEXK nuclease domain-containing protein [Prosthecobacter sp.]MDZ4401879.1 PDDEXK nuclease domain-containing protein [Prosthecobacter sp.]
MKPIFSTSYAPLLADLKARVRAAQMKAAVSVNRELILLYWHIGREILRAQKAEGWGAKVVERLAKDLAAEFPEMDGFSPLNLKRMRAFYAAWAPIKILPQPVGESSAPIVSQAVTQLRKAKVQQPVAELVSRPVTQLDDPPEPLSLLPWSTNLILLHKLKDPATRLWYARKTLENGWSRAVLTVQIESRLHERSGKAITNFALTLPPAQSDLAREALKDPYTFDFLSLSEEAHERDLERGLVEHVQKLLLEMGAGFAFVGRQVPLEVGDEDFYLDLLFYHLRLRCFVVVDLKMKPFEPEFAGKMNFYLSAVDDQMRHADDAPTIGLLLCKDAKNKLKVEYALRDVKKPIGVAEWQTRLVESLPKKLQGSLPTIADIERELNQPANAKVKAKTKKK